MRITLLNLPNKFSVIRRYMCSYNAPGFLFPPLELMYLAAVADKIEGYQVRLIDAIALKLNLEQTINRLKECNPEILLFISGFEIFAEDMQTVERLKAEFPQTKFIAIGYYPTVFPQEVLDNSRIDAIILGEPEQTFSELCSRLNNRTSLDGLLGLAYRDEGKIKINAPRPRITDLDSLAFPERSLIDNALYSEPFLGRPFTTILSARGCPYRCSYCVHTYGNKLVCRSAENILAEIEEITQKYRINFFRFLDDTFTANQRRVMQICQLLLQRGIKARWSALSRVDTLESQMLKMMRRAGCLRLYVGIESGSQKVLDDYDKGYQADQICHKVNLIHSAGISAAGFFMVGSPKENREDFAQTLALAKKCKLDYCTIFQALPYPGTRFYEQMKEKIEFSLFPYKNCLKDQELEKRIRSFENIFLKSYYLRPGYIISKLSFLIRHPVQLFCAGIMFIKYLLRPEQKTRGDLI